MVNDAVFGNEIEIKLVILVIQNFYSGDDLCSTVVNEIQAKFLQS